MKILLVASFCICLLPVAALCAEKYDDLKIYYPSSVGSSWVYETPKDDAGAKTKIIESNDELFMSLTVAKIGFKDIYEKRGNKILLIARQNTVEGEAINNLKKLENPRIELVSPLKKGTKWNMSSYLSEEQLRCSIDLINSFTVKAGTFNNVVKRSCTIYKNEKGKWKQAFGYGHITYFAPNVGMIKQISEKSGFIWYELIEYDIK